jgi:hypothetical protein
LALSVLNNEKKQFLQSFNDKYRSKMAKEKLMLKETRGTKSPFQDMSSKHMLTATYAPDMVTWTKKDIAKLLKTAKKPGDQ